MSDEIKPTIKELFTSFLRLGLTAFGGPSMVVYIRRMAVEKKQWLDRENFNYGVALCQMIPGATAMQTAAYVGLKAYGVSGAAVSFIAFGLPAFILMLLLAYLYSFTHNLPVVISAFSGLQAIIVAIIAYATLSFGKNTIKGLNALIVAVMAAALFGIDVNPILVIILAAIGGLILMKPEQGSNNTSGEDRKNHPYLKPLILILSVALVCILFLFILERNLFNLTILMMKIDLFAFGGGFASVPLMLHEIVEVRNWMDNQTFMNAIILGQITPGPIVITATFIGYFLKGFPGSVIATVSIFFPSFIMVIFFTPYFDRLRTSPVFNKLINGVLCSFVGLLFTVTIRFAGNVEWDFSHLLVGLGALGALFLKTDLLWVVIGGILISLILFSVV
jgi:chromate transporter